MSSSHRLTVSGPNSQMKIQSRMLSDMRFRRRLPTYGEFRRIMHNLQRKSIDKKRGTSRSSKRVSHELPVHSIIELRKDALHQVMVRHAKSVIDQRPVRIREAAVMAIPQLAAGVAKKQDIFCKNLMLLCRINEIQRLHGKVESFNQRDYPSHRDCHQLRTFLSDVKEKNRRIGCRLLGVKSMVDTHNPLSPPVPPMKRDAPEPTVQKYRQYMPGEKSSTKHAQALLRPVIFFDLAVRNGRPLGRILIQLFTEVSPEVVLEFVRMATYNDVSAHRILRIFPDLWLEGELEQRIQTDMLPKNHYSRSPLDPSQLSGILSYTWDYRKDFPHGLLNYSISFRPLTVVPLRRVVFGRVMDGDRVLQCLRDFGTKNGKTKNPIEVVRCGLI
ncbi:uncharacterized protein LOC115623266 [Scaptodrosophila lebanonensis]|uniref:Uncharacterized protein LOC115623266 n=1 Tax=Drosophila lebanonensis TaxID=7225 RepID=A0A6J2TEH8_DROLE|nr:uncharacterized protein LOC115623266 [Scaptodrosophila lebanonensis]